MIILRGHMKQRDVAKLADPSVVAAQAGSKTIPAAPKLAFKPAQADRYRHRVDRSQSQAARAKGYRKGRGAAEGPKGRFEVTEHVSFDDGWGSEQTRFEDLIQRPTTVSEDRAKSVLTFNQSPDLGFDRSVNPYRGCEHGCTYCYARPSHAFMGLSAGLDFETKLFAKHNVADLLEDALRKPGYKVAPIALGTNTDPYQPVEAQLKITRSIIEVLCSFRHPFSIITKGHLITRDLDLLVPMAQRQLCHVAVSVTTLDRNLKRILEPRTPDGQKRLAAITALSDEGINVTMMAAPIIPCINDHELETLMQAGKSAGAHDARYILIRLPHEISPMFRNWLKAHFPERAMKVMSVIRQSRDGKDYQGEFGLRMTGSGEFASLLRQRWRISHRQLGFDASENRFELDCSQFRRHPQQMNLF